MLKKLARGDDMATQTGTIQVRVEDNDGWLRTTRDDAA